jgi:hypothetical protein
MPFFFWLSHGFSYQFLLYLDTHWLEIEIYFCGFFFKKLQFTLIDLYSHAHFIILEQTSHHLPISPSKQTIPWRQVHWAQML